jgi:hypothetical protein
MKILFRMGAAILIAAVMFATLGPPRYRPHSPLGQDGEHAFAFVLVGLAVGFPQRRLLVAAVSVMLIGLLEIMQLWAPGRHARLEDFSGRCHGGVYRLRRRCRGRLVCHTMERTKIPISLGGPNLSCLGAF